MALEVRRWRNRGAHLQPDNASHSTVVARARIHTFCILPDRLAEKGRSLGPAVRSRASASWLAVSGFAADPAPAVGRRLTRSLLIGCGGSPYSPAAGADHSRGNRFQVGTLPDSCLKCHWPGR